MIAYSRGLNTYDNFPEARKVANWQAFEEKVCADRSRNKGKAYICAPLSANGEGKTHRCKEGVLPRRFLGFDVDKVADAETGTQMRLWFARFRGFGWETHSSTPSSPRYRIIVGLKREADREECIRLGEMIARDVAEEFGERVKLDETQYRGEQPLYTPPTKGERFKLGGEPLEVDSLLESAPRQPARKATQAPGKIVAEGGRNNMLTSLGGRLRRHGLTQTEIQAALGAINAGRCNPPLKDSEIEGIAKSVSRYEAKDDPHVADTLIELSHDARQTMSNDNAIEIPQCIPGRIPAGLVLIVGRPKSRKSWLALQIALARTSGKETLGKSCEPCRVLGLFLEDNDFRMRARLAFLGLTAETAPENFEIRYQWPTGALGVEGLHQWLARWPDTGLIVVDTLQRFRGAKDPRQGAYEADYQSLGMLQGLAAEHAGLTIFALHHLRKGITADPVEAISGTAAIAGAADNYVVLLRRLDENARWAVHIGGRDWASWDDEFAWEFRQGVGWVWLGAVGPETTDRQDDILAMARQSGHVTPTMVAEKFEIKEPTAYEQLKALVKKGVLYNDGRGRYKPVAVTVP